MALKDLQRRTMQSGRIRLGAKVPTKNGGSRPGKLTTFRFTSGNRLAIAGIADLFGGDARPWDGAPTPGQWEVITEADVIPVAVPPGDAALSQWYELWGGGGCLRRCDSDVEQISGGPCLCPKIQEQRDALAAKGEACKPTTRLSLIIPDAPGLGTWRLDSHGWNAANELGGVAEILAAIRERGVIVPANLRLEQRTTKRNGQTSHYVVPMLDVLPTMRELTTLQPGDIRSSLPPAPPALRAIGGAPAERPKVEAPKAWQGQPATDTDGQAVDDKPADAPGTPPGGIAVPDSPEALAVAARAAVTAKGVDVVRLRWLWTHANAQSWLDEWVPSVDNAGPDAEYLTVTDLLKDLSAKGQKK